VNGIKKKYIAYIMIGTILIYGIVRYFNVVEGYIKNITKEIKKGGSKIYALIIADDKFEPDGIFDAAWQRKNREKANIFEVRCEK